MEAFRKYRLSFLLGILFLLIFFVWPATISGKITFKDNLPAIYAFGGFLIAIPIKIFWDDYKKPYLKIVEIIPVLSDIPQYSPYITVSRVIVENEGRTAAVNCKGYFATVSGKERVCWNIPSNRSTITINAKDREALDYCGFGETKFFVPTEEGWGSVREYGIFHGKSAEEEDETTSAVRINHRFHYSMPDGPYEVLISSENTDPVKRGIRIDWNNKKIELI